MMSLLGAEAFRLSFSDCLSEAIEEVVVLTAFATVPGFSWLVGKIGNQQLPGKLVVRWRVDDLLSGASDLAVYGRAKQNGWDVYIYQDLHAKAFLIDQKTVFVGSANITASGLSLVPGANKELGTRFSASEQDLGVFENVLTEATLVTDDLFEQLNTYIASLPKIEKFTKSLSWPADIIEKLEKPPNGLWVADMLWTTPEGFERGNKLETVAPSDVAHDVRALGLEGLDCSDEEFLKRSFLKSRPWKWLYNQLLSAENKELYFGRLSSLLHDALLDDPGPYRKDVNGLLQNLYLWASFYGDDIVSIDVPGVKSQRIRIV